MHDDRDYLVKFVFPELRRLCETRNVVWSEVDLRWGVPDEDRDEVLPICLDEVQRCRPFFIGLLGERYGHVPLILDARVLERFPWVAEHTGASITELEIIEGTLRPQASGARAFFYFRDPAYVESQRQEERGQYVEDDAASAMRLRALKARLRQAHDAGTCSLREGYRGPAQLGDWVLEDFRQAINRLFPEDQDRDLLALETAEHHSFALSRTRLYVQPPRLFDALDAHVRTHGPPLVITGAEGAGKSSLISNWLIGHAGFDAEGFGLVHFVGATLNSANAHRMLFRLMAALKRRFPQFLKKRLPTDRHEIVSQFPDWLMQVPSNAPVAIVIDRLDLLEGADDGVFLSWLPTQLPSHIRLVLSAAEGEHLAVLRRRGYTEVAIPPLDYAGRITFVRSFLAKCGRRLGQPQLERIASTDRAANPLFLAVMLDELRQFGAADRLDNYLEQLCGARDIEHLYELVISRWERDFGPTFVKECLSVLWGARRGLSEDELRELTGDTRGPTPHRAWSPLYFAAETTLARQSGFLVFRQAQARRATQQRYLSSAGSKRHLHLKLGLYFSTRHLPGDAHERDRVLGSRDNAEATRRYGMTARDLDEAPWHLEQAGAWDLLATLLKDPACVALLWSMREHDVLRWWSAIHTHSVHRALDAYRTFVNASDSPADQVLAILTVLYHLGESREVLSAGSQMLRRLDGTSRPALARRLAELLALAALKTDNPAEAQRFLDRTEESSAAGDSVSPEILGTRAIALKASGDLAGALALLEQQERIYRSRKDATNLYACLTNQANVLKRLGRRNEAVSRYEEAISACRERNDRRGLAMVLVNLGAMLEEGEYLTAVAPAREALQIAREYGQREVAAHASATLKRVAQRLFHTAREAFGHNDARTIESLDEAIALSETIGDNEGVIGGLNLLGVVKRTCGDVRGALDAFRKGEHVSTQCSNHEHIAVFKANEAAILALQPDTIAEARRLAEGAHRLARQHDLKELEPELRAILDHIDRQST